MIKKTVVAFVAMIISMQLFSADYIKTGAMYGGEIVRLHVIANSNSKEDQELKLKVRDAVLTVSDRIVKTKNSSDAAMLILESVPEMEKQAKRVIAENGYDYNVQVVTGVFDFPARSYQNITLPKGKYSAVRVIIGEGAGENWWCVMFPPLCFTDKTTAYMPAADAVINTAGEIKIKSKILEILTE